jgi:hypothetical protein
MAHRISDLVENLKAPSNGEWTPDLRIGSASTERNSFAPRGLTEAMGERPIVTGGVEDWDPCPLTNACLDKALKIFTAAYQGDYYDTDSMDFARVQLIFSMAEEEGYGPRELLARLRAMVKACPFPTWTPADFFKERAAVHPYGWYLKQLDETKANAALIDCYELADGSHGWGWKHEVRDMLPLYRPNEKPAPKELPDHAEPMPDDVAAQLKAFVADVDVKELERADMETTIQRLRSERDAARMERDTANQATQFWKQAAADWEDAAAALQVIVSDVIDGRITIDELRARVSDEATTEKEAA